MNKTHRTSPDDLSAVAHDVFTSEGGRVPTAEGEHEMVELGIRRDGPDYDYRGYRYEELSDAVAYARQTRSRPAEDDVGPPRPHRQAVVLGDADGALMASLGIRFDGRTFLFAGYRYDRLADAVQYARLAPGAR